MKCGNRETLKRLKDTFVVSFHNLNCRMLNVAVRSIGL